MLFQIRACARLAVSQTGEAAEDLLTGLSLANLSRQIPDVASVARAQLMLARSLQPLWEGMIDQRWSESQLNAFQDELARFNLLTDYTNAIRRVVLAHIENWRSMRVSDDAKVSPQAYRESPFFGMQPRIWWLDNCIQIYEAGQAAIHQVDVANSRMHVQFFWNDLDGLPLDSQATYVLQQPYWSAPGGYSPSVVFSQIAINQAILACALERFRLAQGKFPETLNQLLPKYLSAIPKDVVRGLPMLYEKSGSARYTLRSVGPNETDDRNKPVSDDWLWTFPTNAPPAKVR